MVRAWPEESHSPETDNVGSRRLVSLRTSIELTPNSLQSACTSIVKLLILGIRQNSAWVLDVGVQNPWRKRDNTKFTVRIIVLEYIIKIYFYMKIQDSPSAMTIGRVVKNNVTTTLRTLS